MKNALHAIKPLIAAAGIAISGLATADIIDPSSYSTSLELGESVTISKTVIVEASGPAQGEALVDIMFLFDVSGSMFEEILLAKIAGDTVLSEMADTYNLMSGSGWYSDTPPAPGFNGVHIDLNDGNTAETSGINDMWDTARCEVAGEFVGCGGDRLELGYDAIADAANNTSWREGAERYIFTMGDAGFKNGIDNNASAAAALADNDVSLLGVTFATDFTSSMQNLIDSSGIAGMVSNTGTDLLDFIRNQILDTYSRVSVDDLDTGLPGIEVSAVCTSADPGADGLGRCVGGEARGRFDRTEDRTFTYDVTFTALEEGIFDFSTFGLVDGKAVATERDIITVGRAPAPGTLLLLGLGITGLLASRRQAFSRRSGNMKSAV